MTEFKAGDKVWWGIGFAIVPVIMLDDDFGEELVCFATDAGKQGIALRHHLYRSHAEAIQAALDAAGVTPAECWKDMGWE